jgi:large subunit ribosomal protein L5
MAEDKKKKDGGKGPGKGAPKGAPKAERKSKKQAAVEVVDTGADEAVSEPAPPARFAIAYREQIAPALKTQFKLKNSLEVPRLDKIVISMGLGRFGVAGGEGRGNIEKAERELSVIAGQKPVRCKAKKSVANFKLREGMDSGLKVTLRGTRMYEFLDRLISLAFPRVKDFRGLSPAAFDGDGNYNFGFTEQTVFPEVDTATVTFQQGMNITMVTTSRNTEQSRELLRAFGFPFRTTEKA